MLQRNCKTIGQKVPFVWHNRKDTAAVVPNPVFALTITKILFFFF